MDSIDRTSLRLITKRMEEALAPLGKELGISFTVGNARFNSQSAKIAVVAAVLGKGGQAQTPERQDYSRFAKLYQLDPEWLDKQFRSRGETYKVAGLKPKSPKWPVIVERDDGKRFKFRAEDVVLAFQLQK